MSRKPLANPAAVDRAFAEVVELITSARLRAVQAVNSTLIDLYWQVGSFISRKIETAEWGEGVVPQLAAYLARTQPGLRGFGRANLFRMRQFHEAWRDHKLVSAVPTQLPPVPARTRKGAIVSAAPGQLAEGETAAGTGVAALLRQLPWTHHLLILGQSKRPEEREFYLRLAIRERWSSRELERQLAGALFERTVLTPPQASPAVSRTHSETLAIFKDAYLVEFLDLPREHAERDLHRGLLLKLRDFLGKLGFYLEALDRDVKKAHERPAIGVLLCASKDEEVVEYALSRTLSPALIAEYRTRLPDKKLLQAKLHEFYLQNAPEEGDT